MKKNKLFSIMIGICCILACCTFVSAGFSSFKTLFSSRFSTPEQALQNDPEAHVNMIIDSVQSGNLALIVFLNSDGNLTNKVAIQDDKGWKNTNRAIDIPSFRKPFGPSFITYGSIEKNYYVIINYIADNSEDIEKPSDNLGSDYLSLQTTYLDSPVFFWFTTFDTKPQDLVLSIDGQEIEII